MSVTFSGSPTGRSSGKWARAAMVSTLESILVGTA